MLTHEVTCGLVCLLGMTVWITGVRTAQGASGPTVEEAIAVIAAHESRISVVSCEIETTIWTLPSDGNVQSA